MKSFLKFKFIEENVSHSKIGISRCDTWRSKFNSRILQFHEYNGQIETVGQIQ
jgi:hypothetical protein